jgi:hypothetical protein
MKISELEFISYEKLLDIYPEIINDLIDIGLWMKTPPENLKYKLKMESIEKFKYTAEGMLETYQTFPQDAKRTNRIVKILNKTKRMLPIFVNPDTNFIMEGRHRIVAFLLTNAKIIPVVYVFIS